LAFLFGNGYNAFNRARMRVAIEWSGGKVMVPIWLAWWAIVAAAFAGVCVFGEVAGCIVALLLGLVCLAFLIKTQLAEVAPTQRSQLCPLSNGALASCFTSFLSFCFPHLHPCQR
jgi:hypothetical protein